MPFGIRPQLSEQALQELAQECLEPGEAFNVFVPVIDRGEHPTVRRLLNRGSRTPQPWWHVGVTQDRLLVFSDTWGMRARKGIKSSSAFAAVDGFYAWPRGAVKVEKVQDLGSLSGLQPSTVWLNARGTRMVFDSSDGAAFRIAEALAPT